MYLPKSFALTDAEVIAQIIEANSFGTLVSAGAGGLQASHLPFDFDQKRGVLRCHMARANPQWRDFDEKTEVMAIFQGAHGYISPRWYETELAVPTWNYLAVHVYGVPRILGDDGEVQELLEKLVAKHENAFETPWKLGSPADSQGDWQAKMRAAIVGFEMKISRLEAKGKMSQNRPANDVAGVISGLEAGHQTELAAWVRQLNPEPTP